MGLKEIRNKNFLTQQELADISGVALKTIQKYESGERDIKKAQVSTLHSLAKALEVTVEEIAGYEAISRKDLESFIKLQNMNREDALVFLINYCGRADKTTHDMILDIVFEDEKKSLGF